MNESPADYLWSEISNKFEKVIPKKYYDFDKSVKSLAEKAEKTRKVNEESQEENKISLFPLKDSRNFIFLPFFHYSIVKELKATQARN